MVQLIMVEGIPGSGKTTTAQCIKTCLEQMGMDVEHYAEGNLDHPADFEQVAVLTDIEWDTLLKQFPDFKMELNKNMISRKSHHLISYGKLHKEAKGHEEVIKVLKKHDIYDGSISPEQHQALLADNWRSFADFHGRSSGVILFECCFLQNPLCALLARFNLDLESIEKHILELEEAIAGLNPLLIYLDTKNPRETLELASQERPKEWLDFMIDYHTSQGYGQANGLNGFDGLVSFMMKRQEYERHIVQRLSLTKLLIDMSTGSRSDLKASLKAFFDKHLVKD